MRLRIVSLAAVTLLLAGCPGDDDDTPMMDAGTDTGMGGDGGSDSGDPCEGKTNLCDTAGTSCDGDTLVTCAADSDGCLVENTQDCSSTDNGTCDESGSSAQCLEDPCAGKTNLCDEESRACDGDSVVICAADADGCLVEETTDCTESNGVCDDEGAMPMCIFPADACADVENPCDTEGTTCDGDELVSCAPDGFGCLVETRTDCESVNTGFCDDSAAEPFCDAIFPVDCEDEFDTCETAGSMCDGLNLVTCAPNAFGCLVESTMDCGAIMFGVCDDSGDPAMCEAQALDPCEGVTTCDDEGRVCNGDTLEVCGYDANGCLVPEDTDCTTDGGSCFDGGEQAVCFGDACPAATANTVELSCANAGTPVDGDTSMGTAMIDDYECTPWNYPRNEVVYRFTNDSAADVNIVATRVSGNGDFDLYALREMPGTICGPSSECLDDSDGTTATEEIDFRILPGETVYISYDLFGTSNEDTTTFTLDITCEVPVCGDGELGAGEECDDMNTTDGDGCAADCTVEDGYLCDDSEPSMCGMVCGDSMVSASYGEVCDDGNTTVGDGCSDVCQVEDGYVCDDSEPSVCMVACGNGEVDSDEECDDGNTDADDGCAADCTIEDGYVCDDADPSVCEIGCGNGEVDSINDEECDDMNTADGDGCAADCTVEDGFSCDGEPSTCTAACGNGELDSGEECDDMNTADGDGCAADCTVEDTFVCRDEPSTCEASCGNGVVDAIAGEECDDSNTTAGDGCADDCTVEAMSNCLGEPSTCAMSCGNSTVDPGESCDGGDHCNANCNIMVQPTVGGVSSVSGSLTDSHPQWGRVNNCTPTTPADHYYETRVVENNTGMTQTIVLDVEWMGVDGYLSVFWEPFSAAFPTDTCIGSTDDFRGTSGSRIVVRIPNGGRFVVVLTTFGAGTTGDYTLNVITASGCGDGWQVPGEECDDGNNDDMDGCDSMCMEEGGDYVCEDTDPTLCRIPGCGDGFVDEGEECDDMNMATGDGCDDMCEIETNYICEDEPSVCRIPACGDGFIDGAEECDDMNTAAGDGCDDNCELEDTHVCSGEPTTCRAITCGDGFIDGDEECDDMNTASGDGCDDSCVLEDTHVCSGEPTTCRAIMCGDGFIDGDEECDDMNTATGDGCDDSCELEATFYCSGEPSVCGAPLFSGELADADPMFTRPGATCSSGFNDRPYDMYVYTNTSGAEQTVDITAAWAFDGYLHVYNNSGFDSSMPTTNCVAGDDDFNPFGGGSASGSQITGVTVAAGESITIVASAFSTGRGTYDIYVIPQP